MMMMMMSGLKVREKMENSVPSPSDYDEAGWLSRIPVRKDPLSMSKCSWQNGSSCC